MVRLGDRGSMVEDEEEGEETHTVSVLGTGEGEKYKLCVY